MHAQPQRNRTSVLRMLDEEAKSEEELAEAQAELAALESKVKKQDETYKAEKASLEQAMTEKVGTQAGGPDGGRGGDR